MGLQMGGQMGGHFKPSKLLKESLKNAEIIEWAVKWAVKWAVILSPPSSCSAVMEAPEAQNNAVRPRTPRENIITPPVPVLLSWRPQRPETTPYVPELPERI